ncbi:hypothetical protein HYW84_00590 [Candidatus Peregrinibacteria bacterium]|nr:hypothetical protein [Candidatus Peregrinibacteria bacterium]
MRDIQQSPLNPDMLLKTVEASSGNGNSNYEGVIIASYTTERHSDGSAWLHALPLAVALADGKVLMFSERLIKP